MTTVPADNVDQPQTSNSGEFGTSEFGERLVYKEEGGCMGGWNDKGWAIFYYIHILLMVSLAIALPLTAPLTDPTASSTTTVSTSATVSPLTASQEAAIKKIVQDLLIATVVTLLIQSIVGALFGLLWLKIMQKFAEFIIKGMLFMLLILYAALAIFGIAYNLIPVTVLAIILFLFTGLYIWCIWGRIPFASALLTIASSITQTFEGTICIAFLVIPMNILWNYIWAFSFYGFLRDDNITGGLVNLVYFLLLLSFYWGIQVNKNISHTTTCGVSATWYFSKEVHKPTMPAFKRTMTTSFGSVCFGSFIVALLQATRQMLRGMKRGPLACIIHCILLCIERLMRYFNMYAFAQCAIYGSSYIEAAKATWSLFASKGFEAIINDDLTGLALFCGAFLSFVVCFFVGWFVAPLMFDDFWPEVFVFLIKILLSIYGGILGYYLCTVVLMVVRSSIVALFVCFAEDPAAMQENRPDEFAMLTGAKAELQTFATTGHTGIGVEQQQQPPPQ